MPRPASYNTQFRRWCNDPILGPFMVTTPQVLNILDFTDRANQQFQEKKENLKTLRDYEKHYQDQLNFVTVLKSSVARLPPSVGANFIRIHNLVELEEGREIEKSWIDWYSHERSQIAPLLATVENGLEAHPDFEILAISGKYHQLRVSTNIKIHELRYRIRQAFEFFHMLHRIFCSPIPAPPPGEPLPFGPENLNPDLPTCPRIESGNFWFDPSLPLRDACIKVTEIFLIATIRDKEYPSYLPPIAPREGELPPWHLLSQTVD